MKTVSSILGLFERQLTQLEAIEKARNGNIVNRKNTIVNLEILNSTDLSEANHAQRVAKKIQEIIQ